MVQSVASQPPAQFDCGIQFDADWQPLNFCGVPNPFFYHSFADDFDNAVDMTYGLWTVTSGGAGVSASIIAGDGGLLQLTSGTTGGFFISVQLAQATFTLPAQPKKMFFETAVTTTNAPATASFIVGVSAVDTTPFTAVPNGVYFSWVGGTGLTFNSSNASVVTSVVIPPAAYTFAAPGQRLELGWALTRQGDLLAYVDNQLVGFIPQSNIGTTNGPKNAGAVARLTAPSLSASNMAPILAFNSTAVSQTIVFDFVQVQKER